MASFWETAKTYDPFAFAEKSMESNTMVAPLLPIVGGAVQAIPALVNLFSKEKAPKSTYDPTAYSRDLQKQIELKTQAAIAQQQAQAAVQVEQIRADSTRRMLVYGAGALAAGIGLIVLVNALKKKGN